MNILAETVPAVIDAKAAFINADCISGTGNRAKI
jgi:hypothetical protein